MDSTGAIAVIPERADALVDITGIGIEVAAARCPGVPAAAGEDASEERPDYRNAWAASGTPPAFRDCERWSGRAFASFRSPIREKPWLY